MTVALHGASFRYPASGFGVSEIELTIGAGELLALIGPSGSGKSTVLKLIAGFERPDTGRVELDGRDVTGLASRRRNLGVVFQNYALFPIMSVLDNVAYPLKVRGVPRAARRRRALEMLERVGLARFADRPPTMLSGGQQQRVALARALVFNPAALLLDEPLSALDASLRAEMRDEIRRLQREQAIATLHITHDQEEALSMADRVGVIEAGRLIQVAPPREIYKHPANRTVAAFIGQSNLWEGVVRDETTIRVPFGTLRVISGHGRAIGEAVTVLVRPERVSVTAARGSTNSFPCRLVRDRYLGPVRRFDAELGAVTVLGETHEEGEITTIAIAPEHVQLLPSHSTTTQQTRRNP
ncbi:MAG: ABC transporter ATP-binding protein [Acetobacteraceae bacterium]